jgi:Tfp pilus assembly protein PilN
MIKINLLPTKRPKRAAQGGPRQPTSKDLYVGIGALAVLGVTVFLAVDMPRRSHLNELRTKNSELESDIASKRQQLAGFAEMQKAEAEAKERAASINRLLAAKVVPAHVLHELGEVLTQNHNPTMTQDMAQRTGIGPNSDPNKRFDPTWDPRHVWLSSFVDTGGQFKLEGGAQSEADVTQLAKRLAASVYFFDVTPAGGERVADRETNVNYYKFTITGKVAY